MSIRPKSGPFFHRDTLMHGFVTKDVWPIGRNIQVKYSDVIRYVGTQYEFTTPDRTPNTTHISANTKKPHLSLSQQPQHPFARMPSPPVRPRHSLFRGLLRRRLNLRASCGSVVARRETVAAKPSRKHSVLFRHWLHILFGPGCGLQPLPGAWRDTGVRPRSSGARRPPPARGTSE